MKRKTNYTRSLTAAALTFGSFAGGAAAAVRTVGIADLSDMDNIYGGEKSASAPGATMTFTQDDFDSEVPENYQLQAEAAAGHGLLKSSVVETRTGTYTAFPPTWTGGSGVDSHVFSFASFSDTLTISADGKSGQAGKAVFQYHVDGGMSAVYQTVAVGTPGGLQPAGASKVFEVHAAWDLYIGAPGDYDSELANGAGGVLDYSYDVNLGESTDTASTEDGTHFFELEFTYGTPFDIEYSLLTHVQVINHDLGNTIIGVGSASFFNTAELESIEVQDAAGNAVSNASLLAQSGTGYTLAAVPEPSSLCLMSIGLLGVLARRKRAGAFRVTGSGAMA